MKTYALVLASLLLTIGANASDLHMFGLTGPVREVVVSYNSPDEMEWATSYSFDAKGSLIAVENVPVEVKRDHEGRIAQYVNIDEDEDGEMVRMLITLFYNEKGQVVKTISRIDEDEWIDTYEYGQDGRLSFHQSEGPDEEGENLILKHTYQYKPENDSQGNWLTRIETSADPSDPVVTQSRKITY